MPPEIHQLSNITANEGDSKSLKCTATGFPLPKVIWLRDNKEYPGQMVGSDMDTCLNLYFIGFRYKTFFIETKLWDYLLQSNSLKLKIRSYTINYSRREILHVSPISGGNLLISAKNC